MIGFTGGRLDRADRLRHDPAALAAAVARPDARVLRFAEYAPEVEDGRLLWAPLDDPRDLVLLGLDGDAPRFARLMAEPAPLRRSADLFHVLEALRPGEAATYAAARAVVDWHARNRFCARCGQATVPFRAGWGRHCPACGTEHFPRTDPVVIMIAEHDGRALLGRQPSFPPGRYSALAGFLEPAESIEEAVAREVWEEAGVRVRDVRYVASQPWPFPSSLMIACIGVAEDDALTIDRTELEDAIWVPREVVARVLAGGEGPFLPPPAFAIAHTLLTAWVG